MEGSPWNSLEVAKLVVSVTTPLLLLGLGGSGWDENWVELFSPVEGRSGPDDIEDAYESLMDRFAGELGVRPSG